MNKMQELNEIVKQYKNRAFKFQKNFNFVIPDYVLDEIITYPNSKSNIICLAKLALLNERIKKEDYEKLVEFIYNEDIEQIIYEKV